MCVCVCVCVCVFVSMSVYKNLFQKSNAKYLTFFIKNLMFKLKLKWGVILWIGGVGCPTPSPPVIELLSPKFLV